MVRREIPLPLSSEAGALLGVSVGDALVLGSATMLGAMTYLANHGALWPLSCALIALGGLLMVPLESEPLWSRLLAWAVYSVSPGCFVPDD